MSENQIFRKKSNKKMGIYNSLNQNSFNNQKREIFMCNNIINQLKEMKRKEKENAIDYIGTITVTKEDDLDSEAQMFIITDALTESNLSSLQIIKKPKFTVKLIIEMLYMFLNYAFMNWLEFQEKMNIYDLKLKMSSISFQKLEPFKVNMYINKLFNCNKNINSYFSSVLGKDFDNNLNYLSEGMNTFLNQNNKKDIDFKINNDINIKYQDDNLNKSNINRSNANANVNDSNISNYENEQNTILGNNIKKMNINDNEHKDEISINKNDQIKELDQELETNSNDQIRENKINNNEFIKKLQKGFVQTYLNNNNNNLNIELKESKENIYGKNEIEAAKVILALLKWIKCCFKRYIYYYNKTKNELDNIKMYKDALIMLHVTEMKKIEKKNKENEEDNVINLSKITNLSKATKQNYIPVLKCQVDEEEFNKKYEKIIEQNQNNKNRLKKTDTELNSKTNNTTSRVRIKELNKSIESISSKVSFKNTLIKEIDINKSKKSIKNYSKFPSFDEETTRNIHSKSNLLLTEIKNKGLKENQNNRTNNGYVRYIFILR